MRHGVFLALLLTATALVAGWLARGVRRGGFDRDRFPTPARRGLAISLLAAVLLVSVVLPFAGGLAGRTLEPGRFSPVSAFAIHAIFALFLVSYYLLSGRPPVADFLRLRTRRPWRLAAAGFPIAAFAWAAAVAVMLAVQGLISVFGPSGAASPKISPIVPWIVGLPVAYKIAIVVSAMIFEEAFFRAFLQPRLGPVAATLLFTMAHGIYGQPVLLVGIAVLSTVLALAFELYGNALPGIVAHGAFDAFEIFVLIPFALRFVGI